MQVITSSPLLQQLGPAIAELLRISGAAGACVGILDGATGETHLAGFGYRDIERKLSPDEHTVYHIASLSKSFTAASIALLVADGRISFQDRICDILPEFRHHSEEVRSRSTVLDFLAHRKGLATKNSLWQQDGHELLLDEKETIPIASYLETIAPLGSKWIYNNWGYDLLAAVIAATSDSTWGEFVSERILEPLDMTETTTSLHVPEENWAHGYMPSPECELDDVGRPVIADGTVQQGANGVKSTVHDLLIYYKTMLDTYRLETEGIGVESDRVTHPLRNVKALVTPYIPLDPDAGPTAGGQWYGAGWAIAELPAPLGRIGTNGMFVDPMPLVGKGCGHEEEGPGKKRIWYHNSSLVGFFSSVHIIAEDGTIIVVLANSITKNDAPDWIGQMLVEHFLGCKERNDYVALAKESADAYDEMWRRLPRDLEKAKMPGSHGRPLIEYAGRYFNATGNWFIEVTYDDDGLAFSFQGRLTQTHRLEVFGQDAFSWLLTEEESRQRGRWPDLDVAMYVFYFGTGGDGSVQTLRWEHDPDVVGGEVFVKDSGKRGKGVSWEEL
ncbi:beta-lactamase/transpeptidase-like protein [Astrocystis sublimbata]|nr:beta-lactamase/transpeptidase-like protein [Astrocystis sublimbata]